MLTAWYSSLVKTLSLDLRERIVAALAAGETQASVAKRFATSLSTVERLAHKQRAGVALTPGVSPGRPPKVSPEQHAAFEQLAASRTDWMLLTLAQAWKEQGGTPLSQATVLRTLRRLGFSYKKSVASQANETNKNGLPSVSA